VDVGWSEPANPSEQSFRASKESHKRLLSGNNADEQQICPSCQFSLECDIKSL
jgi:hypothetical protein